MVAPWNKAVIGLISEEVWAPNRSVVVSICGKSVPNKDPPIAAAAPTPTIKAIDGLPTQAKRGDSFAKSNNPKTKGGKTSNSVSKEPPVKA